jgi:acyl carrier protein
VAARLELELPSITHPIMTSTIHKLQSLMRDVFMDSSIQIDAQMTALDVPGWDSLSHTLLLLEIEASFGVHVDLEKVANCADIGQLVGYIDSLSA